MIRSMTGFARAETRQHPVTVRWELRSVNHRYLDLSLRLPETARGWEPELRGLLSTRLGRGKIDASLQLQTEAEASTGQQLNLEVAKQIVEHAQAVAAELRDPDRIDPLAILRWPGVLTAEEIEAESLRPAVLAALTSAVTELDAARTREGEKITAMLEARCAEILQGVAAVRARLPAVQQALQTRLTERLAALGVQADPGRLEQELALLVQKLDVSEELDRLEAHVAEVRNTLAATEPVGRRLDFLMQELNREANTLASKSADQETTRQSVDLKVVIEQMREQVQNVE
jgi:uncharacterized protein (TIGR00255 family)